MGAPIQQIMIVCIDNDTESLFRWSMPSSSILMYIPRDISNIIVIHILCNNLMVLKMKISYNTLFKALGHITKFSEYHFYGRNYTKNRT